MQAVLVLMTDQITVVGQETGRAQINANGDGIEHFFMPSLASL